MFLRSTLPIWIGIIVLSGMFLIGQQTWPTCTDLDGDGYGNPADPSCDHPGLDCNDHDREINPGITEALYGDLVCGDGKDNDCDGYPDAEDAGCAVRSSCMDILDDDLSSGNGIYWIDPDGSGGLDPFEAYCDMETDGGGWTLVFHTWYTGSCPLSTDWTVTYAEFETESRATPTTYQGINTQSLYMMQLISFKSLADQSQTLRFESDNFPIHTTCENVSMQTDYNIDCSNEDTVRTEMCGGYLNCFIDGGFSSFDVDQDNHSWNCSSDLAFDVGWWYDDCWSYNATDTCWIATHDGYRYFSSKDSSTDHWSWWVR